ncbi:hypothetical protein [Arcobacter sp. F2176]|uniref:hypothetical protein n=1 Tax=Arcobacter sp. F2176 TaxID=2044511 RepID=UPI00100A4CE5|nr:hypothetical protein [Arcobacter sp. F2176]RXJ82634.1 hypothetical protein CRU95_00795 [Arcobacter sp. F2176]
MQNKTSITDNYNKINKNNKFSKKFVYCIVKTLLGNTYKCKIIYENKKTICINWFNGKRYFSPKTLLSNELSIVKFLND